MNIDLLRYISRFTDSEIIMYSIMGITPVNVYPLVCDLTRAGAVSDIKKIYTAKPFEFRYNELELVKLAIRYNLFELLHFYESLGLEYYCLKGQMIKPTTLKMVKYVTSRVYALDYGGRDGHDESDVIDEFIKVTRNFHICPDFRSSDKSLINLIRYPRHVGEYELFIIDSIIDKREKSYVDNRGLKILVAYPEINGFAIDDITIPSVLRAGGKCDRIGTKLSMRKARELRDVGLITTREFNECLIVNGYSCDIPETESIEIEMFYGIQNPKIKNHLEMFPVILSYESSAKLTWWLIGEGIPIKFHIPDWIMNHSTDVKTGKLINNYTPQRYIASCISLEHVILMMKMPEMMKNSSMVKMPSMKEFLETDRLDCAFCYMNSDIPTLIPQFHRSSDIKSLVTTDFILNRCRGFIPNNNLVTMSEIIKSDYHVKFADERYKFVGVDEYLYLLRHGVLMYPNLSMYPLVGKSYNFDISIPRFNGKKNVVETLIFLLNMCDDSKLCVQNTLSINTCIEHCDGLTGADFEKICNGISNNGNSNLLKLMVGCISRYLVFPNVTISKIIYNNVNDTDVRILCSYVCTAHAVIDHFVSKKYCMRNEKIYVVHKVGILTDDHLAFLGKFDKVSKDYVLNRDILKFYIRSETKIPKTIRVRKKDLTDVCIELGIIKDSRELTMSKTRELFK